MLQGDAAGGTGRTPQVSGLRSPGGTLTPVGPNDTIRLVANDFMYTGGDGYAALAPVTGWPARG